MQKYNYFFVKSLFYEPYLYLKVYHSAMFYNTVIQNNNNQDPGVDTVKKPKKKIIKNIYSQRR